MSGSNLPEVDNVVRHVGATLIHEDGSVDGSAFRLKGARRKLSVNWLEAFEVAEKFEQLAQVRRLIRRKLGSNGRFAELEVGETIHHLAQELEVRIRICSTPLDATEEYEADPSHADILDLPPEGDPMAELVSEVIVDDCVKYPLHPAKSP